MKNNKLQESFSNFLESMDNLYDAVVNIMDVPMNRYSAEDWDKLSRRVNKLSDEFNLIFEKNAWED